jgi:aminopeptidase N
MNFLYFNAPYSLDARAEFANKCMKLYSKLWGIYPFAREKYGQAQIGWGGGMENQTMTFLGVFTQDVVAHELSHQWFGDYITCGSWHEIYLNEAFASYMEGLVARYGLTNYTFYDWLKRTRALALTDSCGSIYVRDTNDVDAIFDYVLVYEKGAYWLRMLRWVMGDSAFMAGIRSYLADSSLAYGFAHTSDLERHMEKACNCDLSYMFGPWLKGEGYPIYTVRFVSGKHGVVVHLKQKGSCSKSPVFKMKLEFLLQGRDTFARRIVWNYTRDTVYKFDEPFAVKYVILDPEQEVLSIVHYQDSTHQIYLYPQPARDFVYLLQIKPNYIKCKLYSSTGKYLKGCEYSGQVLRLNLRSLPAGTYRLGVKEGNGETLKFQIIKK